MKLNNVVLIGRLTRDPELRYIPGNGTAVTKFGLAVNRDLSKAKKEELESKGYPTADFINIIIWGKTAESAANYLVKGRLVGIQGRIQRGISRRGKDRSTSRCSDRISTVFK